MNDRNKEIRELKRRLKKVENNSRIQKIGLWRIVWEKHKRLSPMLYQA